MADVIQRSLLEEQAQTIMASIIDNHQNHLVRDGEVVI